ncbi:hypothetical protein SMACR_03326 [Sordaria macrospora]|uniref:WGS project CABT00000000 data, contig 2.10 n=2 Tax=Sordaria macrospora TaxID=5147 RepID=F7VWK2_SORMK|nr:uncharacterized protein SMAC_03326 [Sordaria macrospora k-hell]KAA8635611.1 hypothetical protein SMACR_03326 [Sordaria macrospora]WPJ66715.1 hypothetical protein SMAC4_03326 [Sordaria macrospora]CCC09770.1 unnamed protein product [Sordaria macrospora k-hell]
MSLDDSPMLEPSHTVANHYKYRAGFPEKSLNEHVPRREGQTKEVASIQATIAVRGPPLSKPDKILTMAEPDRPYDMWPDPDHGLKDTRGALIPEGLNDNRDGTFSIVGTHQLGAPRVVSKRRVSLHKDPTVETCLPSLKKAEIEEEERKRRQMGASMVKHTTHKPAADPEGLWKYICSMVDDDLARPTHPSFDHLLALPRIRDLNIIDKRLNPKHLIHSTLTVGLVIQVTGVERQTKQCTACRRGDGPFQECVSICPELANEVAQSNPPLATSPSNRWCCMNCVVNRQTSQCSLKASMLERSEDGSVKERIPHWMVDSEQRPPAGMTKKLKEASQDTVSVDDETNSSYRRSGRLRPQFETKPSSASPKRSFESMDMAFSQVAAAASQEEEASSSLRASKRVRGMQSPATVLTSSIQDSLMVEDWEMEAKVIPRGNGSSDNLALSSSYQQNSSASYSTQIIPSSFPSLSMYVIRIPSGSSHCLGGATTSNESQHQNRMCTVISGKLRVKIQAVDDETDNAEFNIGLLGVFKLVVGMEAKVENRGYIDAVLQVVGTY